MIDFTNWPIIGSGSERICYLNPNDPTRCIKVSNKKNSKQTRREIKYLKFLEKNKIPFTHMPVLFNTFENDDLIVMEVEFINSSTGITQDIHNFIAGHMSLKKKVNFFLALDEIKKYLIRYNVIPCDLVLSNMLVLEDGDNIKIMMIDGFGGAELFPISNFISYFGRKKIERKWDDFIVRRVIPCFELNASKHRNLDD